MNFSSYYKGILQKEDNLINRILENSFTIGKNMVNYIYYYGWRLIMKTDLTIEKGKILPKGISRYKDGINIAVKIPKGKDCGIFLWIKTEKGKEKKYSIPFQNDYRIGDISCIYLPNTPADKCRYQIYADGAVVKDVYAAKIEGHEKWGKAVQQKDIYYRIYDPEFTWEQDNTLKTPFEDSYFYCMHVRGFTKHKSSGVEHKGTFRGVIEKIPYLKELGITAIEIMPAYEFDEAVLPLESRLSMEEAARQYTQNLNDPKKSMKLNYWGYTKDNQYFVPKASYASEPKKSQEEFKEMVKELHKNGIELIMQFYFEKENPGFILEVIKFWRMEYHVDGFHLKGDNIPLILLGTEELLKDTKLFYYSFPYEEIYKDGENVSYRHLASYRDDCMYDFRRYLKGDENMLPAILGHMRHNSDNHGVIQYITNYYGFTLADLVSFDRKHNLENGEENHDGNDFNYSWNCGTEGTTRKKSVLELRKKQMRNALNLLFLSQATPAFLAGDEFGNSQKGNNNPYCLDNDVTWLNWSLLEKNKEWFEYVKSLIAFRKKHPVLHGTHTIRLMDTLACGYPDVSYHGSQAWRAELENYNRHVGVLYAGNYGKKNRTEDDNTFFIAFNMHWQKRKLALPKLPKGKEWYILTTTEKGESIPAVEDVTEKTGRVVEIELSPRTIVIYVAK